MSNCTLHIYPGYEQPGSALAKLLGCDSSAIALHTFPDGESRIRVGATNNTALVYASLDHPNEKLVNLIFVAQALRDMGAKRVVLICPYLCYMRQDKAFHSGEAVSQHVIGALLPQSFDRILTVDPHLHRVSSLDEIFPTIEADALSATGPISEAIKGETAFDGALLVGPDSESEQWLAAVSERTGLDYIIASKKRSGDRDVIVTLANADRANGRLAIIVDDIVSSGTTIRRCASLLLDAGASRVEVIAVHALCNDDDQNLMTASGISRLRSCNSVLHATNAIDLASLLADALKKEL